MKPFYSKKFADEPEVVRQLQLFKANTRMK